MFFLYEVAHCSYWLSSACNYIVGGIFSFFLNKYFTFQNHHKSVLQIVLFALNVAVCYFLAYGVAKRLALAILSTQEEAVRTRVAMLFGMVLYTVLNYFGQKLLVFREKSHE